MCAAPDLFPVIEIESDAYSVEFLGTKEKFWVFHEDQLALVKFPRPGTGEHWAEKIASHIAEELGIPHADYDLAEAESRKATISPSFVPEDSSLIHGNELLNEFVEDYDDSIPRFRQTAHTLEVVMAILDSTDLQHDTLRNLSASGLFVGYLLFDALIGNTDRHHENWGLLAQGTDAGVTARLAPSYDHASCLACHEQPQKLLERLDGPDPRMTVESYCSRARSALYRYNGDPRPLPTLDAFRLAAARHPPAAEFWLDRLGRITPAFVDTLLERMPESYMPVVNKRFAREMIRCNRSRLAAISEEIR